MLVNKYGFYGDEFTTIETPVNVSNNSTLMCSLKYDPALGIIGIGYNRESLEALGTPNKYRILIIPNTGIQFAFSNGLYLYEDIKEGEYYNCSMVLDNSMLKAYVNGVFVGSDTYTNFGNFEQLRLIYTYFRDITAPTGEYYFKSVIYDIKYFDSVLTEIQIQSEMTENNIQAVGFWDLNQNTLDSSGNGNDGTVTGTEQYTIVGTEHINGELFERKETESFASTDYYKWDVTDWVYGGSFTIDVNVTGNKTIKTWLFYDEDDKAYVYNSQTTTDQQITVDLPDTEARSMIIEVISDNDFTSITYTFEHIAPIVVYDESISVGVSTYDTTVNYANNQTLSDSVSVRINKEDSNLFKTIVENNLYFMDKERAVLSYNFSELDTTRYMFDLSLTRLL